MATAELIDDPAPANELALIQRESSGPMALAQLSEKDFESRLKALGLARERVRRIQKELMTEGEDYDVIPGTRKRSLLKPGAETLCQAYRLVPTFAKTVTLGDGETTPDVRVIAACYLHLGDSEGPIVGEGGGAANNWERRYRYRTGQKACPSCGVEGSIRRSKFERDGDKGWYCNEKAGGCGAAFRSSDPAIVEQQAGQIDNPDPFDMENTLLKMAMKRAQVDAVLRATATSGLFTQDLEDLPDARKPDPKAEPPIKPASRTNGAAVAPAGNGATVPAAGGPGTNGNSGGGEAAVDPSIGKVKTVTEQQDGAGKPYWTVTLTTGFVCATRDKALGEAAADASQRNLVVECHTRAPRDARYAPTLMELSKRAGG